ncbi:MAG: hypothetical protein H8M99_15480 [Gloeobacteraceae cyanobacterium ES-bin-144]|nr:hypothetical protein [Verrucomicrobiales bacterium]
MKTTLILCALAIHSFAAQPILVRVTPEAIAKLQAKVPMTTVAKPAGGEEKVARPENQSIVKQSTILHDGQNWTLVPIGSVVFIPEALKSRVNVKPLGTLLSWTDFLTKNRSWITTNEVSFDQAAGNEAIPSERSAFWAKQDKIVVAVHQFGPISVRISEPTPILTKR